jgi:hypothetical protein
VEDEPDQRGDEPVTCKNCHNPGRLTSQLAALQKDRSVADATETSTLRGAGLCGASARRARCPFMRSTIRTLKTRRAPRPCTVK